MDKPLVQTPSRSTRTLPGSIDPHQRIGIPAELNLAAGVRGPDLSWCRKSIVI